MGYRWVWPPKLENLTTRHFQWMELGRLAEAHLQQAQASEAEAGSGDPTSNQTVSERFYDASPERGAEASSGPKLPDRKLTK